MKKSVVAGFVVLALIVLVSPGIVGKLAERSVDEQLKWVADENQEVVITWEKFDRGWFSSAGRHRIEFGQAGAGEDLKRQLGYDTGEPTPAIIVDTRLDHGLIPVGSISEDEGTLMPGLGHAVSTISIESADGSVMTLPGIVNSHVGLDGALSSTYQLEAGANQGVRWGAGNVALNADARKGLFVVDGNIESLSFTGPGEQAISMGRFAVASDMAMTDFGYAVGNLILSIGSLNIASESGDVSVGPTRVSGSSAIDDERLNVRADMDVAVTGLAGDVGWSFDFVLDGADAAAVGRLQRAAKRAHGSQDPGALFAYMEKDLMDLAASGLDLRFDRLNVTVPQGTVVSKLSFGLPPTDRQSFAWTSLLLGLKAKADITIPGAVYEYASTMSPQIAMAAGMGFLKKTGDNYEMAAEYKKGLLTVNGAPIPIPLTMPAP